MNRGIAAPSLDPTTILATLRVFQILKEADGLDRVRLKDLDVSKLRLPGGTAH